MKIITNRLLNLQLPPNQSAFLQGSRKAGKTYWINKTFPDLLLFDVLKTLIVVLLCHI